MIKWEHSIFSSVVWLCGQPAGRHATSSSLLAMNGESDLLLDWIWRFDDDVHPAVIIGELPCIRA
jgi:hypothetical protein